MHMHNDFALPTSSKHLLYLTHQGAAYALNVHRDHVKRVAIVDFGKYS